MASIDLISTLALVGRSVTYTFGGLVLTSTVIAIFARFDPVWGRTSFIERFLVVIFGTCMFLAKAVPIALTAGAIGGAIYWSFTN